MERSSARARFAQHKARARARGIEFEFTFDEWWAIWEPRFFERGPRKGQLGMCRTRDQGAYRSGNVRLDTPKGNAGDRVLMRRHPWHAADPQVSRGTSYETAIFKSHGSSFLPPDRALEVARGEEDFEPYQ